MRQASSSVPLSRRRDGIVNSDLPHKACRSRLVSWHREPTDRKTRSKLNLNRRQFLGGGLAGASLLLGAADQSASAISAGAATAPKRTSVLQPGSLPYPKPPPVPIRCPR